MKGEGPAPQPVLRSRAPKWRASNPCIPLLVTDSTRPYVYGKGGRASALEGSYFWSFSFGSEEIEAVLGFTSTVAQSLSQAARGGVSGNQVS